MGKGLLRRETQTHIGTDEMLFRNVPRKVVFGIERKLMQRRIGRESTWPTIAVGGIRAFIILVIIASSTIPTHPIINTHLKALVRFSSIEEEAII